MESENRLTLLCDKLAQIYFNKERILHATTLRSILTFKLPKKSAKMFIQRNAFSTS